MTKILLVEDDRSLREIYGVRLLAEGYDIVSAGDGEEALAMAIKEQPTLIVSDVMMPKISGFDMLDILRSTPETKDTKVIMMTALSSEDQRERGEQLGADRYLVKSQVGIEDVVRTVHEVLNDTPNGASAAAPQPPATEEVEDTPLEMEAISEEEIAAANPEEEKAPALQSAAQGAPNRGIVIQPLSEQAAQTPQPAPTSEETPAPNPLQP